MQALTQMPFYLQKRVARRKGFLVLDGMASVAIYASFALAGLGFYLMTQPGRDGEALARELGNCSEILSVLYRTGSKGTLDTELAIDACELNPEYLDTEDPASATKVVSNGGETNITWSSATINAAPDPNVQVLSVFNLPSDQCVRFTNYMADIFDDIGVVATSGTTIDYENLQKSTDGSSPTLDPGNLSVRCNSSEFVTVGGRLL